jgi:L-fuconolactonase
VIDAHHHLWEYNDRDYVWMTDAMGLLRRNFLIPELQEVMRESGVNGTVVVQARQSIEETEWLLKIVGNKPFILGVVGWVPLTDATVGEHLARVSGDRHLKAVRHVLHDEPDHFFMLRKDFNRGVSQLLEYDLAYDILIFEHHLPQTIEFVDRHPNQVFVVDHIAKPRIRNGVMLPWREQIVELAKRENVFCKISGLTTEADWTNWTVDELRPYFDVILEAFGVRRLMFGSDWPVVNLSGGYKKWMMAIKTLIHPLSEDEKIRICSGTARLAYKLEKMPHLPISC